MGVKRRVTRSFAILLGGLVSAFASGCGRAVSAPPAGPEPGEVVVVGYGTQDRDDVTGSVSSLTREDLKHVRVARVEELLEGRVPGLQVMRNAGGISLRIRGVNSLMGNNEPLVVIDGVPIRSFGSTSALSGINPGDIARVDVLKDAGSTAIYGSRGANGVILITTRRAR